MSTQITDRPTGVELKPGDVITHPRQFGEFTVTTTEADPTRFETRQADGTYRVETGTAVLVTHRRTGEAMRFVAALSYRWNRVSSAPKADAELFQSEDGKRWRLAGTDASGGRMFVPEQVDPAKVARWVWAKEAELVEAVGALSPVVAA
ncbi:hypothetical protein AB0L49_02535 [Streptomyces antimycoticus]|uniref:hypothetical protein n=1 Tax=Streptomyces antimycoticus TaxID=68175 RepID=UPI0034299175